MSRRLRTDALLVLAFFPSVFCLLTHARYSRQIALALPPPWLSNNVPYWLLARGMQRIVGPTLLALLACNTLLMLLLAWLLFEVGRNLSTSRRHPVAGATAGLVLFQLCPLVLSLPGVPIIRGWDGGRLLIPVVVVAFIGSMLALAHWSTFMRSIALAFVWSFLIWVHPPTAGIVLAAMIPWVFYSRRPLASLGTWLTLALLGMILFVVVWIAVRLLFGHGIWPRGMIQYATSYGVALRQFLIQPAWPQRKDLAEHLRGLMTGASPSLLLLGFWMVGRSMQFMVRERRASVPDLVALLSLAFFVVLMLRPFEDAGSGWRLLTLVGLMCLQVARELSNRGRLARDFRIVALLGFLCTAAACLIGAKDSIELVKPGFAAIAAVAGGIVAAGALSYWMESSRGLTFSNRLQALLAGSTLGFFVVSDGVVGAGLSFMR